jgi:hypothetical protein
MRQFSMGYVYGIPQGANPTPIPYALVKGASCEAKQSKVPLRGQYKYPLDFGDGEGDLSVKIAHADFRVSSITALTTGATSATGSRLIAPGETNAIPTTPFQITVVQSATFIEDAGVYDVTAGKWMTRGATSTGANIYAVSAGVYTFNTADVGHSVVIYYSYSSASVGATGTYLNQVQGPSTYFGVRIYNVYTIGGVVKPAGWEFPQVHFQSLSMAFKTGDWTEVNLEGMASADIGQTLYKVYSGE